MLATPLGQAFLIRLQDLSAAAIFSQSIGVSTQQRITIIYPDGSRGKVSLDQKCDMLRDGVLKAIDSHRFRYVGRAFRFSSLGDLALYKKVITSTRRMRAYRGIFLWVHKGRRWWEILETPDHLVMRLGLEPDEPIEPANQ